MNKCISNEARSASKDFGQRIHMRHTVGKMTSGSNQYSIIRAKMSLVLRRWMDKWTSAVLITISYLILVDGWEKGLMISNRAECGHTEGLLFWSGSAKPFCWPEWNASFLELDLLSTSTYLSSAPFPSCSWTLLRLVATVHSLFVFWPYKFKLSSL